MIASTEEKSVYRVVAQHLQHATKSGNYIKGYIDGKEKLDAFFTDYYIHSKTRFITRSSCKKKKDYSIAGAKPSSVCTRYGKEGLYDDEYSYVFPIHKLQSEITLPWLE